MKSDELGHSKINEVKNTWLLMPAGLTQLSTMLATLKMLGIPFQQARVLSNISVYNSAMDQCLRDCCRLFSIPFLGNYYNYIDFAGIPLEELSPSARRNFNADPKSFTIEWLKAKYADLAPYQGDSVMIMARPNMIEDLYYLTVIDPPNTILVADGSPPEILFRSLKGEHWAGCHDALREFPTSTPIYCPASLCQDNHHLGPTIPINKAILDEIYHCIRDSDIGRKLRSTIFSLNNLPKSIILSQHMALSRYCSVENEIDYYSQIISFLVKNQLTPVLFKRHPRDTIEKQKMLQERFVDFKSSIIFTDDYTSCIPIECLYEVWRDKPLTLVGSFSSSLKTFSSEPQHNRICFDVVYLPDSMRRYILGFAVRNCVSIIRADHGNIPATVHSLEAASLP